MTLKPCPFCGGSAVMTKRERYSCKVKPHVVSFASPKEAVKCWNRRKGEDDISRPTDPAQPSHQIDPIEAIEIIRHAVAAQKHDESLWCDGPSTSRELILMSELTKLHAIIEQVTR